MKDDDRESPDTDAQHSGESRSDRFARGLFAASVVFIAFGVLSPFLHAFLFGFPMKEGEVMEIILYGLSAFFVVVGVLGILTVRRKDQRKQ